MEDVNVPITLKGGIAKNAKIFSMIFHGDRPWGNKLTPVDVSFNSIPLKDFMQKVKGMVIAWILKTKLRIFNS